MICIPKLALEIRDISLLALLLLPRIDDKKCLRYWYAVLRAYRCTLIPLHRPNCPHIMYFGVTCGVEMMPVHHSWGWYPPQTTSHIHTTLVCCLTDVWVQHYIIIPAMLAPDFEILGHLWSVNDAIAWWSRLTCTSDRPHPYGHHHLSFLYKGHTLAILLDMLCPCWDLVIAHKSQSFEHGLWDVVNPFCHVVREVVLQLWVPTLVCSSKEHEQEILFVTYSLCLLWFNQVWCIQVTARHSLLNELGPQ